MSSPNLLCLYMKVPAPGKVKTRLAADIGPNLALKLYRACVEDLIQKLSPTGEWDLEIHFSPAKGLNELQEWLGEEHSYRPQSEGNLGERMATTFARAFERGYQQVIIIGSDLPHLSIREIQSAFNRLRENSVVFGPSTDGGYYLVGLNRNLPAIFQNIPWSTAKVLAESLKICRQHCYSYFLLPEKTDLDDGRSLFIYRKLMNENEDFRNEAPRTFRCLNEIFNAKLPALSQTVPANRP